MVRRHHSGCHAYEHVGERLSLRPFVAYAWRGTTLAPSLKPSCKGVPAMSKSRVSFWLLMSLIPAFGTCSAALALSSPIGEPSNSWDIIGGLSVVYFGIALIAGCILYWLGRKDEAFDDAQRYAERNGWHPISKYVWRSRKREGAALSVNRAYKQKTYLLTIEHQAETTTVEEFERADWAMQFGDWLWEELRAAGHQIDVGVLQEKRGEWEQTRALARRE